LDDLLEDVEEDVTIDENDNNKKNAGSANEQVEDAIEISKEQWRRRGLATYCKDNIHAQVWLFYKCG